MKKSSHDSTSHHSKDRTGKVHRVDTKSSHRDGNTSDTPTAPLLGGRKKGSSEKAKEKEYLRVSGSGKWHHKSISRKKEENSQNSEHPYSQVMTTDQKAHEKEQKASKSIKYPSDPITLFRYSRYQSKIKSKIALNAAAQESEERESRTGIIPWSHWRKTIVGLEELAEKIRKIENGGLSPVEANRALDELLDSNKHLFQP